MSDAARDGGSLEMGADSAEPSGDAQPLSNDRGAETDGEPHDATPTPASDQMVGPADAGLLEQCTHLGRCNTAGGWCEAAGHPDCWRAEAPACYDELHPLSRANCGMQMNLADPVCTCPVGFQPSPGEDICVKATSGHAQENEEMHRVCAGPKTADYGAAGALFEDTDGDASNNIVHDSYWGPTEPNDRESGRLNQVGVWACDWQVPDQSGFDPLNEWIGFSHCLGVDEPGDYLVGISGDNRVRLRLNGTVVFESPEEENASNYWYVRRLSLNSGINIVEFLAYNTDAVGSLGAEISGPFDVGSLDSEAQQKAADYAGRIFFTTASAIGSDVTLGTTSGWTCPEEFHVVNTCRVPTRCTRIEHAACEAPPLVCPDGQHVVDDACVDNECTCAFGLPTVAADCPTDGLEGCSACFEGFHLQEGACLENECECENGFAAGSAACVENGASICLFCDPGYRLENNRCLPFQCVCEGGEGPTGPACPEDGAQACVDCNEGLHVENGLCVLNQCLCRHGVFDDAAPCPADGAEACSSCRGGYHLDQANCFENTCECENGNGALGPDCWLDGASWCTQCMAGHRLEDGQCMPYQCACINGTGAQGADCPAEGRLRCANCNLGYRLEGNVCVQSDCLCANGQPSVGAACPEPGVNHCSSCIEGFELTADNTCAALECPCDNGQPSIGQACPAEGAQLCINCNDGYDIADGICVLRACQCEDGVAATGLNCPEAGSVHCVDCNAGYILDGRVCTPEL